ncbi:MAG TPA: PDZ domain-containing protein [Gemmatimonadaceae bacterium]|nr:PDZ domain-containing protein [Gemmatimonadaceae bacterium]
MLRKLGFAVVTFGTAHASLAQAQRISAPISDISYEITADSSAVGRRQLGVAMSFTVAGTAPVILALPAWSPGHYVLLWFSRRVSQFSAESGGTQLQWRKLDFQTWEIIPRSAGTVRVSFNYLADAVDRAVAWTAPNFAFFNGTNVFLYPRGRGFNWPARVSVRTESSWRVATGMDPSAGVNNFTAGNYHDLTDMPFYVGRFALDSAQIAGKWIRLAWYPAASLTPARRDRAFGWLQKFVPAHIAIFGEAPFRNYTLFQRSDTVVNGGGLEHQSSQVDEVTTSALDGNLSGLYSHEFFHAWNVKRLRPADLVPYRYDDAQQTTWLWVSEGVTDYYGALGLVRGGVNDSTGFFNFIANEIASVAGAPPTAVSDASFGAWIAPTDGSGGLYYPKGGLTGFLLDIMIRDASDNRMSLDNVMRRLYDATWKQGKGFTGAEWWSEVSRAAGGKSFTEFARRYVDGREPLPVDSVLRLAGLRSESDTIREPRLGVSTAIDSSGVSITQLSPTGAAAAAGARAGDKIVSIGDVAVSNDASFEALRGRYAGTTLTAVPLVVRRGGETITLQLPVRLVTRVQTRVLPIPNASPKALRIRGGILKGTIT